MNCISTVLKSSVVKVVVLVWGFLFLGTIAADAKKGKEPYKEYDAFFSNGETQLAGTLTVPRKKGRYPAVVLLSGSGPQTRDSDMVGFKGFKVIADYLSRRGIAVLRFDDRGVGKSSGPSWQQAKMEDFASDALAAVNWLKGRKDINPMKIGILGHSEGGAVAPLAYSLDKTLAFLILMAGTGASGEEVLLYQNREIFSAMGSDEKAIQEQLDFVSELSKVIRSGEGWDDFEEKKKEDFRQTWEDADANTRVLMGEKEAFAEQSVAQTFRPYRIPWFKHFLEYSPVPYLEQVQCPVLALWGGKDLQVAVKQNEAPVLAALKKAGNPEVKSVTFPDANHLFQPAKTGNPAEYALLPKAFVDGFLEEIASWIAGL